MKQYIIERRGFFVKPAKWFYEFVIEPALWPAKATLMIVVWGLVFIPVATVLLLEFA